MEQWKLKVKNEAVDIFTNENAEVQDVLQPGDRPDGKLHSKRVGKIEKYTRNEWRRLKSTLQTSGEDVKLHSKRVKKM